MSVQQRQEANLFELEGGSVRISYSLSSIAGVPLLSYQDDRRQLSFQGEEIRRSESEIGAQVTVTLEAVPDLHTQTLTLLVPTVQLRGGPAAIEAVAVLTTHRTSIAGPQLLEGALQLYCPVSLRGTARAVDF